MFNKIFCVSDNDYRQIKMNISNDKIYKIGNPRYDRILNNLENVEYKLDLSIKDEGNILIFASMWDEDNKITGFEAGADDYMVKPFSPNELIARINALLRRHSRNKSNNLSLIVSDLFLDLKEHKAYRDKKRINLGPTEFKLLKFFMENPKRVFSREQLLDSVWGHGIFVEFRTVDTHIRRLRKAINLPNLPDAIRTVRSAGYSLDLE